MEKACLMIIACLILWGCSTERSSDSQKKQKVLDAESVDYEIIESEDQSHKALGNKLLSDFTMQELVALPIDKKMLYRVAVSPEIKENQVRPTIETIISNITSQGIDIDEISLFLYSDKELVSGVYDVAMATWAPNGKLGNITPEIADNNDRSSYRISVQTKNNLEEYLQQRGLSEERFGFTEAERRKIFKEIVAAEDRAMIEAEKIYPIDISNPNYKQENLMKNIDRESELSDKYKAGVRAKYGITEDIETKITSEAFQESWPLE